MDEAFTEKAFCGDTDEQMAQVLEELIRTDNKDEFISFLRSRQEKSGLDTSIFSPTKLIKLVCLHRAVGCATALLEGMTPLDVNLTAMLDEGFSPLHLASQSLSYDLIKLFIRHGAETDLYHGDGSEDPAILPLSAALNAICRHEFVSDWTPKKSVMKLFYIFCLPELKEPLDTIELLASRTCFTKVEAICLHCVKEGAVVQLAALLLVDRDLSVAPHHHIEQWISGELNLLQHEIDTILKKCPRGNRLSRDYKRKKANIESVDKILELLWRAHDVIENYRRSSWPKRVPRHQVPFDLGCRLFFEANLELKRKDLHSDDIKCLRLKPDDEGGTSGCVTSGTSEPSGHLSFPPSSLNYSRYLPSRSLHTRRGWSKSTNIVDHQLVMKPSVPAAVKICARLILTAKSFVRKL